LGQSGPYAPAAGEPGSGAVAVNDPAIAGWASGWTNYLVGLNCDVDFQTPEKAIGSAFSDSFDIVCLGEGGSITLSFDEPLADGPGNDFAVFENAFDDTFLELAFVEVSSDGVEFLRFDTHSLTEDPVGSWGAVDPTAVDGFAGKYRQGFATPFDLGRLVGRSASVDLQGIRFIRFVDIPGDGSQLDSQGNVIYDPFPSVGSAGFDLEAVAVLHYSGEEVCLAVTDAEAGEHEVDAGTFVVRRKSWDLSRPLSVEFALAGSAEPGFDFEVVPSPITIPAGHVEQVIEIVPIVDMRPEGMETVTLRLMEAASYSLGASVSATLEISDQPVDAWRLNYFGAEAASALAADSSDPDLDGRSNLLEYCVGSDPLKQEIAPVLRIVPVEDETASGWALEFPHRETLTDAVVGWDFRLDLGEATEWSLGEGRQESLGPAVDGVVLMRTWVSDSIVSSSQCFFRLKAQRQ